MSLEHKSFTFDLSDSAGSRLDLFLSIKTGRSRAFVKSQIERQAVRVNGKAADKPSQRLRLGDVVGAEFEADRALDLIPVKADLELLYEDEELLVLNKPQGWVVHPAAGHRGETVVHYLLHHMQNSPGFSETSPVRPGIVHRLDRGTSGCLVVAKNRTSLERLSLQFKNRSVKKEYEAIVYGNLKTGTGTFRSSIGRHPTDRKKMSGRSLDGREAVTDWIKTGIYRHFNLVELFPLTGRTHQLRVHLTENGHPIVGDGLYGARAVGRLQQSSMSPVFKNHVSETRYTFLHAKALSFFHPVTGDAIEIKAPRPENFKKFLSLLETFDPV